VPSAAQPQKCRHRRRDAKRQRQKTQRAETDRVNRDSTQTVIINLRQYHRWDSSASKGFDTDKVREGSQRLEYTRNAIESSRTASLKIFDFINFYFPKNGNIDDIMLNAFRFAGDLFHVVSILLLLLRLRVTKNANGISIKTQEIYLLVFVTRYLDLFTTFYSLYNTLMKILYLGTTSYIIYMVRYMEPFKTQYEVSHDSFLHWKFAVAPCAVVALITNIYQGFNPIEVSSKFSI
jgi:hypothetical protein